MKIRDIVLTLSVCILSTVFSFSGCSEAYAAVASENNPGGSVGLSLSRLGSSSSMLTREDFTDEVFYNELLKKADRNADKKLSGEEVSYITEISHHGSESEGWIRSIQGIDKLTSLEDISFSGDIISDISMIVGLTNLKSANFYNNNIMEIPDFSTLSSLKILNLDGNLLTEKKLNEAYLPTVLLSNEPDYVGKTMVTQKIGLSISYPKTVYAQGSIFPFEVYIEGKAGNDLGQVSVEYNGKSIILQRSGYRPFYQVEDLKAGGFNIQGGQTYNFKIRLEDVQGNVLTEKNDDFRFEDDIPAVRNPYIYKRDRWLYLEVVQSGFYSRKQVGNFDILDSDGNILVSAKNENIQIDHYNKDYRLEITNGLNGYYSHGDGLLPEKDWNMTEYTAYFELSRSLKPGDYNLGITVDGKRIILADALHVIDDGEEAIITNFEIREECSKKGNDVCVRIEGFNIDPSRLVPVLGARGEQITEDDPISYHPFSIGSASPSVIVYRLKKKKCKFWEYLNKTDIVYTSIYVDCSIKSKRDYYFKDLRIRSVGLLGYGYGYDYVEDCTYSKAYGLRLFFTDQVPIGTDVKVKLYASYEDMRDDRNAVAAGITVVNDNRESLVSFIDNEGNKYTILREGLIYDQYHIRCFFSGKMNASTDTYGLYWWPPVSDGGEETTILDKIECSAFLNEKDFPLTVSLFERNYSKLANQFEVTQSEVENGKYYSSFKLTEKKLRSVDLTKNYDIIVTTYGRPYAPISVVDHDDSLLKVFRGDQNENNKKDDKQNKDEDDKNENIEKDKESEKSIEEKYSENTASEETLKAAANTQTLNSTYIGYTATISMNKVVPFTKSKREVVSHLNLRLDARKTDGTAAGISVKKVKSTKPKKGFAKVTVKLKGSTKEEKKAVKKLNKSFRKISIVVESAGSESSVKK